MSVGCRRLIVFMSLMSLMSLGGCKMMSVSSYDELMEYKQKAQELEPKLIALIKDKDQLEKENAQLKRQLGTQDDMVKATAGTLKTMDATLEALRKRNAEMEEELAKRKGVGGLPEGVGYIEGPHGEAGFRIEGDILFASGSHTLKTSAKKVLGQVADILKGRPGQIRVCGFTDSDPIRKTKNKYSSNFHLSAMRALSVLEELKAAGIPAERMHIAGFGPHQLVRDATTGKEIKQKSRRAEIWLLGPATQ